MPGLVIGLCDGSGMARPDTLLAHDLIRKPVPTFRDHAPRYFAWRMILSENRFPLFGIMRSDILLGA
jgi:hypothetical protein